MSQDMDMLVELCILREEIKKLKRDLLQLQQENESLVNRLSQRRPSVGVKRQIGKLRKMWGEDGAETESRSSTKDPSRPTPYRPLFS